MSMKNLLVFILLLNAGIVVASPVKPTEAFRKAMAFFKNKEVTVESLNYVEPQNLAKGRDVVSASNPAFYAFNNGENEGFVIIAGDDLLPDVVGYAPDGYIPDIYDELPCCLRLFLDSYTQYVDDVRQGKAKKPAKANGVSMGTPVVEPLLTSKWGQDSPYNMYCPNNDPVGCVATAMAQILLKWKWPETGKGSLTYTNDYGEYTTDFSQSTYNWSIMRPSYSTLDIKKRVEACEAAALISKDCGMATYMSYNPSGSGTHSQYVPRALVKFFSYKASTLDYMRRDCCSSKERFLSIIKHELDEGRPVYFSAKSSTGGGSDAGGHAFVVDGYDTEDFVHVNWGWNGSSNGYYDVSVMDGSSYTFNGDQCIYYGIEPDYEGIDTTLRQCRIYLVNAPVVIIKSVSQSKTFDVKIKVFYNSHPFSNSFHIAIGMFDYDGQLLDIVTTDDNNTFLAAWNGFSDYDPLTCKVPEKYSAEGYYYLSVVTRQDGYDDWVLPDKTGGPEKNRIYIHVKDGLVYFNEERPELNGDINGDGSVNITDVVETINLIAAGSYSSAADLNADNAVNISDVVQIINIIAGL